MMQQMVLERAGGGTVHAIDERYCIDNGLMIAHTGRLQYEATEDKSMYQEISDCTVTQRFRTDQVLAIWRTD